MKTPRASFFALAAMAFLGVLLAAPPALADRADCEMSCASKGSESLNACIERCPPPALPSKGGAGAKFQSCAMRCKAKYDKTFSACTKNCPKNGPSGKEKAASVPEDEQ